MQLLHPFMPFATEEIYHQLRKRKDDITVSEYSPVKKIHKDLLVKGELLKEVITAIRDARNRNQLKPRDQLRLHILANEKAIYKSLNPIITKQVNAESISFTQSAITNSITVVVQKDKFFIETSSGTDSTAQKKQLEKDLEYLRGFLASVEKKLGNERFVQNAKPEVIESEKKKKADAEAKIRIIEESLAALN